MSERTTGADITSDAVERLGRRILELEARVPTDAEIAAIRAIVADDGVPAESVEWFAAFDTLRAYLERQR